MIGFGAKEPTRIHRRALSIPSVRAQPQKIGCSQGCDTSTAGTLILIKPQGPELVAWIKPRTSMMLDQASPKWSQCLRLMYPCVEPSRVLHLEPFFINLVDESILDR